MPYAKITYLPVENAEDAEWCDKKHLMEVWQGLSKGTLTAWLTEMRDRPEFKKGVLNPTHGLVFINKEVFKEFVEWKEATRYKSYKKQEKTMKNTILTSREADALLQSSLIEGAKWIITRTTDTVLYQGKTMNFTPLRSGGVLLEVY